MNDDLTHFDSDVRCKLIRLKRIHISLRDGSFYSFYLQASNQEQCLRGINSRLPSWQQRTAIYSTMIRNPRQVNKPWPICQAHIFAELHDTEPLIKDKCFLSNAWLKLKTIRKSQLRSVNELGPREHLAFHRQVL